MNSNKSLLKQLKAALALADKAFRSIYKDSLYKVKQALDQLPLSKGKSLAVGGGASSAAHQRRS